MITILEKKTKWQILVAYNNDGNDFIIFCRRGLKSGMLYFKAKRITPFATCSYNLKPDLFDIKKQFDVILNEEGKK